MGTTGIEDMGPVDVVLIGFPKDAPMTGESVPILLDLVDRGIIRVFDVLVVQKQGDGTFSGLQVSDLGSESIGDLVVFEGASTGLLDDDDVAAAADAMEPGEAAVMIMYENRWAAPFAAAVRRNGGVLIDTQRIPHADLLAALERIESAA